MVAPALGSPDEAVIFIPGIFPCNAELILPPELLLTSSPEKEVIAPDMSRFICEPYPTTTTSSRILSFSSISTSIFVFPFTGISTSCIPIKVNTSVPSAGTSDILYLPSMLVIEPLFVFLIITLTPGIGSLLSAYTTRPLTVMVFTCANNPE
ncbi:hypothetical protein SDC9_56887 [bioreactor metagenome]|uniref:Uncharacterized protein n=1 Tax=bioreactor metagenome TaxID=1076179 RepID=A0A644X326_9ZZZZ